jgi:tRNA(Ile)-lysidine synthase
MHLPGGPATVALSGGADSAALALLVKRSGAEIRCLHVDHGLAASPALARAAASIADVLELDMEKVEVTLAPGPSPEERAREARYSALEAWPGPVLTGHTRDDNAETILINLVRGTGPDGLTGIPRFRPPNIFRPMLDVSRSEAREIAELADLPFMDDPMNSDLSLTRNRIRHSILPLLTELNPKVVESMARAAQTLERDISYLRDLAPSTSGPSVAAGLVMTLPRPLADRLLVDLLRASEMSVTSDRLERLWSVVRGESHSQELGEGKIVQRHGALVVVSR